MGLKQHKIFPSIIIIIIGCSLLLSTHATQQEEIKDLVPKSTAFRSWFKTAATFATDSFQKATQVGKHAYQSTKSFAEETALSPTAQYLRDSLFIKDNLSSSFEKVPSLEELPHDSNDQMSLPPIKLRSQILQQTSPEPVPLRPSQAPISPTSQTPIPTIHKNDHQEHAKQHESSWRDSTINTNESFFPNYIMSSFSLLMHPVSTMFLLVSQFVWISYYCFCSTPTPPPPIATSTTPPLQIPTNPPQSHSSIQNTHSTPQNTHSTPQLHSISAPAPESTSNNPTPPYSLITAPNQPSYPPIPHHQDAYPPQHIYPLVVQPTGAVLEHTQQVPPERQTFSQKIDTFPKKASFLILSFTMLFVVCFLFYEFFIDVTNEYHKQHAALERENSDKYHLMPTYCQPEGLDPSKFKWFQSGLSLLFDYSDYCTGIMVDLEYKKVSRPGVAAKILGDYVGHASSLVNKAITSIFRIDSWTSLVSFSAFAIIIMAFVFSYSVQCCLSQGMSFLDCCFCCANKKDSCCSLCCYAIGAGCIHCCSKSVCCCDESTLERYGLFAANPQSVSNLRPTQQMLTYQQHSHAVYPLSEQYYMGPPFPPTSAIYSQMGHPYSLPYYYQQQSYPFQPYYHQHLPYPQYPPHYHPQQPSPYILYPPFPPQPQDSHSSHYNHPQQHQTSPSTDLSPAHFHQNPIQRFTEHHHPRPVTPILTSYPSVALPPQKPLEDHKSPQIIDNVDDKHDRVSSSNVPEASQTTDPYSENDQAPGTTYVNITVTKEVSQTTDDFHPNVLTTISATLIDLATDTPENTCDTTKQNEDTVTEDPPSDSEVASQSTQETCNISSQVEQTAYISCDVENMSHHTNNTSINVSPEELNPVQDDKPEMI